MKILIVYSQHSAQELDLLPEIQDELYGVPHIIKTVEEVGETYGIRATPAIILIRDDLQGEELLVRESGKLKLVGRILEQLQDEERYLYGKGDKERVDEYINREVMRKFDKVKKQLMDLGVDIS